MASSAFGELGERTGAARVAASSRAAVGSSFFIFGAPVGWWLQRAGACVAHANVIKLARRWRSIASFLISSGVPFVANAVRIWDLPTRPLPLVTGDLRDRAGRHRQVGGDAMNWHFRLGYAVFTLLCSGCCGAWSAATGRALPASSDAGRLALPGRARHGARHGGHNRWARCLCWALLAVLSVQVGTGLFADDEIASARAADGAGVRQRGVGGDHLAQVLGQYLVIGLVVLHVLAIVIYRLRRHDLSRRCCTATSHWRAPCRQHATASASRLLALVLLAVCAGVVYAVVQLGNRPMLG